MYNYSVKLTYKNLDEEHCDTQYRKELLDVFSMKEYDEEMLKKQDELFKHVKGEYTEIINHIISNDRLSLIRKVNENDAFMILFSWSKVISFLNNSFIINPHVKHLYL